MLLPGRSKVPGRIKQGGGPDSASGPCVCHLCLEAQLQMSESEMGSTDQKQDFSRTAFPLEALENKPLPSFPRF